MPYGIEKMSGGYKHESGKSGKRKTYAHEPMTAGDYLRSRRKAGRNAKNSCKRTPWT